MVKEFTLNRCPSCKAGQMMTPDRDSCCGVISRRDPLQKGNQVPSPEADATSRATALCTSPRLRGESALQKYLLIAFGGALGSIARYWVGSTVAGRMGIRFPYGTLLVNLTACVIIGFSLTSSAGAPSSTRPGDFSFPSASSAPTVPFPPMSGRRCPRCAPAHFFLAALYAVGSLVLGLVATWGGSAACRSALMTIAHYVDARLQLQ